MLTSRYVDISTCRHLDMSTSRHDDLDMTTSRHLGIWACRHVEMLTLSTVRLDSAYSLRSDGVERAYLEMPPGSLFQPQPGRESPEEICRWAVGPRAPMGKWALGPGTWPGALSPAWHGAVGPAVREARINKNQKKSIKSNKENIDFV